jgi:preprotein translocase subunit SecA
MQTKQVEWEPEHNRVVDSGGLYVVGTERHESRRIDNQLRGRSGRQGDPGATRFYLSLEDELMRLFSGDRLASIMERLRMPDDLPIEARMVSRAIERAQGNVEQQNFEIRKNVLQYDDVLNTQRKVIYEERNRILEGEDFSEHAKELLEDVVTAAVDTFASPDVYEEDRDVAGLIVALEELYPTKVRKEDVEMLSYDETREVVLRDLHEAYAAKESQLGAETMRAAERMVLLNVLDAAWRDHLYEMDYLREGIGLRAMGQRDPLVEYQREGYEMFQNLTGRIREEFTKYIFHVSTAVEEAPRQAPRPQGLQYTAPAKTSDAAEVQQRAQKQAAAAQAQANAEAQMASGGSTMAGPSDMGDDGSEIVYETIRRDGDKVGRNDPCPCGSGKKYKRCHGMGAAGAP